MKPKYGIIKGKYEVQRGHQMQRAIIGFSGTRNIEVPPLLLNAVITNVIANDCNIVVGDSRGVDQQVGYQVLDHNQESRMSVFCVGDYSQADPAGFWRSTAIHFVRDARDKKCEMRWNAGGKGQHITERLRNRSRAMVERIRECQEPRSGLIAFVAGDWGTSPGTWGTVQYAVNLGIQVVVFPIGCDMSVFPKFNRGRWECAGSNLWATGFKWENLQPFLFAHWV